MANRKSPQKPAPALAVAQRPTENPAFPVLDQLAVNGSCLMAFSEFMEEARPEEILLLRDILQEYESCSGSFHQGNFFRAVAEGVLAGNVEQLPRLP